MKTWSKVERRIHKERERGSQDRRGWQDRYQERRGYIFQNIGYLRGKPVVCILMDHPVYGAQFISKSKVMAAGLRPAFWPTNPSALPPPPRAAARSRPGTLKFQTNTKMAGISRNMYCPISSGYPVTKGTGCARQRRADCRVKIIHCSPGRWRTMALWLRYG